MTERVRDRWREERVRGRYTYNIVERRRRMGRELNSQLVAREESGRKKRNVKWRGRKYDIRE